MCGVCNVSVGVVYVYVVCVWYECVVYMYVYRV